MNTIYIVQYCTGGRDCTHSVIDCTGGIISVHFNEEDAEEARAQVYDPAFVEQWEVE